MAPHDSGRANSGSSGGVWFPTHRSVEGQPPRVLAPAFPAPPEAALMSVVGDTFHVSVNADYNWTGGQLGLSDAAGLLRFSYPGVPDEFRTTATYRLTGDDLLLCSRPEDRGRLWYAEYATRYVRVAVEPTPEMLTLFESMMRRWVWTEESPVGR